MFILNRDHKVYHNEDCHYVRMMKEENKQICKNRPTYARPCSHCRPELNDLLSEETFEEEASVSIWDKYLEESY